MKKLARRIAVVIGAVAVSAGLIGATAVPAHAEKAGGASIVKGLDSQWPW